MFQLLLAAGLGQTAARGGLAACLPAGGRAEGPACEPLVLVIPTPPFPLVGQ